MHQATRRALRGRAAFFVLMAAVIVGAPSVSPAQATPARQTEERQTIDARIQELVAKIETQRAELDELSEKIAQNADRAAAVMMEKEVSERRAEFRRQVGSLVDLVLEGQDAGAEVAQGRATATEILEADGAAMRQSLIEQGSKIITLVDTATKAAPEEAQKATKELTGEVGSSTRLVKYLKSNIDRREALGLDVKGDTEFLAKHVESRANVTAALLKSWKQQIDELATRPGVDQDAEAQKQLAALRKGRDALAEAQRVNVDLMDGFGLETAQFRRGIISATGKLSEDILDKDVAVGLLESTIADAGDWFRSNGTQLVFQTFTFLLILFAFWILARIARGTVRRLLERSKLQVSSLAKEFFIKMTSRLVMLFGVIIAIAQLGVEIAPLLAGLGIAGFIVGFALQDTLSNFAAGLMILVYRPFDVGDAVEAGGVTGKVDQMNLVSTMILTFDNQLLIVPNKQVWGGIIRNITHQEIRRVDMTFGIGYSDDIPKAEKILTEIVTEHEKVLSDPEPVIRLHTLGESSVDFVVRPWSKTSDYWDVYWDVTREVKRRFDAEGVSIPFPQRDVHVYHEAGKGAPGEGAAQRSAQTPAPRDDED